MKTRKQALIEWLYQGHSVSIKTAYTLFGISNPSREIRRLVEIPLGIELKRTIKNATTKYGSRCEWYEYSATEANKKVLKKYLDSLPNKNKNAILA
jgi:hypothetical protein